MPEPIARAAIDRAVASVEAGGTVELAFAGGEPLIEALLIQRLVAHARQQVSRAGKHLALALTTHGLVTTPAAWAVMLDPAVDLAVCHDGLPAIHDQQRQGTDRHGTSERTLATIHRLAQLAEPFRVAMLVSPHTAGNLADGIEFLFNMGVPRVEPVLDLWTDWDEAGLLRLEQAIAGAASVWAEFRPRHGVSWFDRQEGSVPPCRFGHGQIAVAPSGHLYPCMSIIGDDADDDPARLPGHALQGSDFAEVQSQARGCGLCDASMLCGTVVRCGSASTWPDARKLTELKRRWDQACRAEAARALRETPAATST
jgi:uncharacterized protein